MSLVGVVRIILRARVHLVLDANALSILRLVATSMRCTDVRYTLCTLRHGHIIGIMAT